ncbi:HNH endonuclease [Pseudotenacibaculum haliotis]|uniref:HNH endonuclease n=1 Tax=Pseudotenacibaculum haliotis TaxID=1862138 RepID=A0ABW5LUZ2_9FLAO
MNTEKKESMRFVGQHGSYGALLFDQRWKDFRKKILERDQHKCRCCGAEGKLEMHHRQYHYSKTLRKYRKPWEYPENLLISLCKTCHQKGHQLYKVPTKYV